MFFFSIRYTNMRVSEVNEAQSKGASMTNSIWRVVMIGSKDEKLEFLVGARTPASRHVKIVRLYRSILKPKIVRIWYETWCEGGRHSSKSRIPYSKIPYDDEYY